MEGAAVWRYGLSRNTWSKTSCAQMIYQRVLLNFATSKYFVLVWRNLKTSAAATNYIRTADNLCIVQWSETEILNICTFCKKIVCQQRYLPSVLFVDRHNWSLSCSMINATCLDVATKLQNCKKMHSWYAYDTHTCLDVATKN